MFDWLSGALRNRKQQQRSTERIRLSLLRKPLRFEQLEDRQMLAAVSWIGSATGNWDIAANWSNQVVPTSTADVSINTTSPATITIQPGDVESVDSLVVGSMDSLSMAGGSLSTVLGLTNNGTITVSAGCSLTVNGAYSQAATATLSLLGSSSATNLATNSDFESPVVTNSTTVPTGWGYWGSAYVSNQYAFTGSQSLLMSGASSGINEAFAVTSGTSYTVSADAMTPAGNALTGNEVGQMELLFYNSSGTLISSYTAPNAITVLTASSATGGALTGSIGGQGWNHFSTSAVAPPNAATAKAVVTTKISSGTGGGEVFWDDVQFWKSVQGPSNFVAGSISNSGAITVSAGCSLTVNGTFSQTSTAILSMPSGGSTANPATNLATNSDFESPVIANSTTVPTGWGYWGTAYLSTQYAFTGSQSLLMSGANSAADETFAITPGAAYTVSADAMMPSGDPLTGNEQGVMELLFYNCSGTLISSYTAPNAITVLTSSSAAGTLTGSAGGQGWNHFETSAVAPLNAATAKAIVTTKINSGTGGGEVFWDDVQFGPSVPGPSNFVAGSISNSGTINVSAGNNLTVNGAFSQTSTATLSMPGGGSTANPATNLATNSDFESPVATNSMTVPTGWSMFNGAYLSTQYAYTGSQSLLTSGSSSGVYETFAVTPGATYTLSADAMMPADDPLTGSETGQMELLFFNSSGTLVSSYAAPNLLTVLTASSTTDGVPGSVGGQEWNHFNTSAVAPSNAATARAEIASKINSGAGGGEVFWDDVQFGKSVVPVPGPSNFVVGSISNSGSITVGPSNKVITGGTFTQTSTGTLDIQLGGAPSSGQFGFVNVTGAATLAGMLKSDIVYGYTPSTTDSFTPVEFAGESGTFSTYALPSSSIYRFAGAATFTNVVISAAPATTVTAAINANANVDAASTNLLGINLGYWNSQLGTTQTQQMVTAAGLDMYRFPGGIAADDYHFNVSNNLGDSSAETLAQFVQFISTVGGTGLLTVDYGSGSPQEAAAELAYLEGSPTDTTTIGTGIEWNDSTGQWQNVNWNTVGYWASLRGASPLTTNDGLNFLRIAHPAPFANIKYWEIGNEQYGSWETDHHGTLGPGGVSTGAQHNPATYATFAQQFATLATEILGTAGLPGISIGIDSANPTGLNDDNWTKNVLADGLSIGFVPGFISDHNYMQGPGTESDSTLLNNTNTNPANILDWSTRYADYESLLQQTLSSKASSVVVMATEFNSVYGEPGKQTTSLVNGLFLADSIGSLLGSGYVGALFYDMSGDPKTDVNNSNLLYGWRTFGDYSVFGDGTNSNPPYNGSYIAYPTYYALQLASKIVASGGEVVSATSNYGDLQVYAVKEPNGHLELLVINTNPAAGLSDQFNLTGFQPGGSAQVWQYGEAQDTAQSQSANGASALANFSATLNLSGANFSYTFPAYSMTVLDLAPALVLNAMSTVTVGNSQRLTFNGANALSLNDAAASGVTIDTVALSVNTGTLNVNLSGGAAISAGTNNTSNLTLRGTVAQLNAALSTLTYAAPATGSSDTLTVIATDGDISSSPFTMKITLLPSLILGK